MVKLKLVVFVIVVAALSALLITHNKEINRLKEGIAAFEVANQDYDSVVAENEQLKSESVPKIRLAQLRRQEGELIRLRAQLAAAAATNTATATNAAARPK